MKFSEHLSALKSTLEDKDHDLVVLASTLREGVQAAQDRMVSELISELRAITSGLSVKISEVSRQGLDFEIPE